MISIVCVYDDEKILNDWLLKSLKNQTVEFELIKVDNTQYIFKLAAEALNYGGKKAKGEYIMFMHQDVYLLADDWLEKAEFFLKKISDLGIAGVAGMRKTKSARMWKVGTIPVESGIGVVYHGRNKEPWRCNKNFEEPAKVQTLDEQLLIVPKNVFENLRFDEKICYNWHLYGVDYSLSVKKLSLKSYVLPLPVWHRSIGSLNREYYITLNRILKKHKNYKKIYTTCGLWYTSNFLNCPKLLITGIRSEIGRWMGRDNVGLRPFLTQIKLLLNR